MLSKVFYQIDVTAKIKGKIMRKILASILFLLLVLAQPVFSQENFASDPLTMLQQYYDSLNRKQYASAFGFLHTDQAFFDYVSGFETTDRIDTYFGASQTNGQDTRVPAVLVSHHTDTSIENYAGCFILGLYPAAGTAYYRIDGTSLQKLAFSGEPSIGSIASFTSTVNCYGTASNYPTQAAKGPGEAGNLLREYFNSIENRNYEIAYRLWLAPIPGPKPNGAPAEDYRPSLPDFINGYSLTRSIAAYTGSMGNYQYGGASAGHSYLDGFQPIVLVGEESNGKITSYSGCFLMGRFLSGGMGIVNGKLQVLVNGVPTADLINSALSIDCSTLAMSY